jgi:hypothetical protein
MNPAQTMPNPAQAMLNPAQPTSWKFLFQFRPAGLMYGLASTTVSSTGLMIALKHLLSLARHHQDFNIYPFGE